MLIGNELISALTALPTLSTQGAVFRVIHIKYAKTALSAIGSFRKGGRYNLAQSFSALYLSADPVTSLLEVEAIVKAGTQIISIPKPPLVVLSIYYQLISILDLTDFDNQRILGTNLQEITGNWVLMNAQGQIAPTQILGEAAYNLQTIEALKVPSARDPNSYNLIVFPDRLSANSFLRVYDDSGTISAQIP